MFDYPTLSVTQRTQILHYLGCVAARPSTRALNQLINAYTRTVPWESVFRIAKHRQTPLLEARPRWPDEFWLNAVEQGGGGTCFESNYAFVALLRSLGYEGYLTLSNMGDTVGCHSSIILVLEGQKRLVDVGIPLHKSLPLQATRRVRVATYFHTYFVQPLGASCYAIERTHHPKRYIYTLIDEPVSDQRYRSVMIQDYGEKGYFLDRIVIYKIIEEKVWRFASDHAPLKLQAFDRASKTEILLPENLLARRLASCFGIERSVIQDALTRLDVP